MEQCFELAKTYIRQRQTRIKQRSLRGLCGSRMKTLRDMNCLKTLRDMNFLATVLGASFFFWTCLASCAILEGGARASRPEPAAAMRTAAAIPAKLCVGPAVNKGDPLPLDTEPR